MFEGPKFSRLYGIIIIVKGERQGPEFPNDPDSVSTLVSPVIYYQRY